jgi:hypothetical protein
MALIDPRDITLFNDVSEGERECFHFLRNSAMADKDFVYWYRPGIQSLESDFVLLSKPKDFW